MLKRGTKAGERIMEISFPPILNNWLNSEKELTGNSKGSIVRKAVHEYMEKKINERLEKTIEIEVYRGCVSGVKNIPKGWNYHINDKD